MRWLMGNSCIFESKTVCVSHRNSENKTIDFTYTFDWEKVPYQHSMFFTISIFHYTSFLQREFYHQSSRLKQISVCVFHEKFVHFHKQTTYFSLNPHKLIFVFAAYFYFFFFLLDLIKFSLKRNSIIKICLIKFFIRRQIDRVLPPI